MPLEESYFEQMKSLIADMKNTGGRMGGSITATLFLKQYVNTEKVEWAHIDSPGAVYDEKLGLGTGYGAAVLADWILKEGKA